MDREGPCHCMCGSFDPVGRSDPGRVVLRGESKSRGVEVGDSTDFYILNLLS